MFARVTLLEVDTVRIGLDEAVTLFTDEVAPVLEQQAGYDGAIVLATPEGKGLIVTMWETAAAADATSAFASSELQRTMTLYKSPPGREQYEVAYLDLPGVSVR